MGQRSKSWSALKYLVANRHRPIPRDELIEVLWPGAKSSQTSANLRVVLSGLRTILEPDRAKGISSAFVLSRGNLLVLGDPAQIWVDVDAFEVLARQVVSHVASGKNAAALALGTQAISLYNGAFMADEPYNDSFPLERHRLRDLCLSVYMHLVKLQEERGEFQNAIDLCRQAIRIDGCHEAAHRNLIRLLFGEGRQDEALRQYATCKRILRITLGVSPSQETENLLFRLEDGEPT